MRLLPIQLCQPGMRLAKSIYNEEGLVLLRERIELTSGIINRLREYGIHMVYIQDELTDDVVVIDPITEETRAKAMSTIRHHFRRIMEEAHRKKSVQHHYLGKDFRYIMGMLIQDLSSHSDALCMLVNMSITDHYLYQHSLNVCIYATMLGISHGYTEDQLMTLGLGALLHDIGKTKVPLHILQKPGKLSDEEFAEIKKHAEIGYRMLKDEPNIPLLSAHCAFQHHERLNGSGYPRGIGKEDIHEYAKWIGLVDSYDAMTTHRVYRNAMLPHQAAEVLFTGTDSLYDKYMVECFRDKVAIYPLGITVKLNTGERGVVVDINASSPQRPIVRLYEDQDGQPIQPPREIDLSKRLSVMVVAVNEIKVEQFI